MVLRSVYALLLAAAGDPTAHQLAADESAVNAHKGPPRHHQSSAYCRRWLAAYWTTAALSLTFLLLALTGSDVPVSALFAVGTGAIAAIGGAAMASHLAHRGIGDRDFDDATASMRIVVVGWLLLVTTIVVGASVGSGGGTRNAAGTEATKDVLSVSESIGPTLFGVAALFVVVGDGYTKYRRLLVASKTR